MFEIDKWQEIINSLSKNKLRTALTAISVSWGIFMLIILLGSGNGLYNGVKEMFTDHSSNGVWVRPGQTSIPYEGTQLGREIRFTNDDYEQVKKSFPEIDHISSLYYSWYNSGLITYKEKSSSLDLRSVHPEMQYIEFCKMLAGRYVNQNDIVDFRKVAILGSNGVKELFGEEDPIGKYINISKIPFKVVGVFQDKIEQFRSGKVYLPITTAQRVFIGSNRVSQIALATRDMTTEENEAFITSLEKDFANRHRFAEQDERALRVFSSFEMFSMISKTLNIIQIFILCVGIGTILAGIVGVGNIMLIVVKERTKEIGVRKALGATPFSIIALILQESILVTSVAGMLGLAGGIFVLDFLGPIVPESDFFVNPNVNLSVAIYATLLLIILGSLAGLFPAWKAARINPVEALRDE